MKKNARIDLSGVDLTPYLRDIRLNPEPTTVRYTPFNYTGWRRWWRRLTFRPVESDTYEFEAEFSPDPEFLPGDDADDVTGFSYSFRATGPIRKVSNPASKPEIRRTPEDELSDGAGWLDEGDDGYPASEPYRTTWAVASERWETPNQDRDPASGPRFTGGWIGRDPDHPSQTLPPDSE